MHTADVSSIAIFFATTVIVLLAPALTQSLPLDLQYTPSNVTLDSALGIDPSFNWETGYNTNSVSNISVATLCLNSAEKLAKGDLGTRIPEAVFTDPSRRMVEIVTQPAGESMEAVQVLWGIWAIMVTWVRRGPDFTEGAIKMYLGQRYLGALVVRRATDSELALPSLGKEISVNAASTLIGNNTRGQSSTNSPQKLSSNPHLSTATAPAPGPRIWLGQGRIFVGLIQSIVGLTEIQAFNPNTGYRFQNEDVNIKIEGGPPNGRPRRTRPFNSKADSIETFGSVYAQMLISNAWIASVVSVYYDATQIATWNILPREIAQEAGNLTTGGQTTGSAGIIVL